MIGRRSCRTASNGICSARLDRSFDVIIRWRDSKNLDWGFPRQPRAAPTEKAPAAVREVMTAYAMPRRIKIFADGAIDPRHGGPLLPAILRRGVHCAQADLRPEFFADALASSAIGEAGYSDHVHVNGEPGFDKVLDKVEAKGVASRPTTTARRQRRRGSPKIMASP